MPPSQKHEKIGNILILQLNEQVKYNSADFVPKKKKSSYNKMVI